MGRQHVWRRNPEVLHRTMLEGVAVLGIDADGPLELGGLAALVWLALADPSTGQQVLDELEASGIELPPDAAGDLSAALAELAGRGLVERL